ncbi:hypothetical protein F1645_10350 [Novacetimonas hansenii]
MKLFPKSFERRRLFEKRQHPETFPVFYKWVVFKHSLIINGEFPRSMRENLCPPACAFTAPIPVKKSCGTVWYRNNSQAVWTPGPHNSYG